MFSFGSEGLFVSLKKKRRRRNRQRWNGQSQNTWQRCHQVCIARPLQPMASSDPLKTLTKPESMSRPPQRRCWSSPCGFARPVGRMLSYWLSAGTQSSRRYGNESAGRTRSITRDPLHIKPVTQTAVLLQRGVRGGVGSLVPELQHQQSFKKGHSWDLSSKNKST